MNFSKIIYSIIVWRIFLFFILFLAIGILPLQFNFLGGTLSRYTQIPYLWSWLNFDGEHYLSLVQYGYRPLEYFFFPGYSLATQFLSSVLGTSAVQIALSGLFVSHITFTLALLGLVKLIQLDYSEKVAHITILLLLLFPTSFFFGSFYTESLFLCEVVWAFYYARRGNWTLAGIVAFLATGTRIVGIALLFAFLVEGYVQGKSIFSKTFVKAVAASAIGALGIIAYMIFLYEKTGDPLNFFTSLHSVFGEQRSSSIVLLPQVFYRYFVRILPVINYTYIPQVFTTYLEIVSGILFLVLTVFVFLKLRASYAMYMIFGYIIPTLSGSFSSFPRYALVLFPGFIVSALYLQNCPSYLRISIYTLLCVLLAISLSYFARGYFIS